MLSMVSKYITIFLVICILLMSISPLDENVDKFLVDEEISTP